jgi:DNA-binding NarL/FixJ family response regulator
VNVRVLIVDDQESFRRAAARVVERMPGFELIGEAHTGEASIEMSLRLSPDLILMDVHLPGIDGVEATRRIFSSKQFGGARPIVVLLSTHDPIDYAPVTKRCGATAYIPKDEFDSAAVRAAWLSAAESCEGGNRR